MRRFLLMSTLCLCTAAATASETDPINWHGIWMNGHNVLWIVAGPTEAVAVAGAAYHQLGPNSYLDSEVNFRAVPMGDKLLLASADCQIELSYADHQIAAREMGHCAVDQVSFAGTYSRQ